MYISMHISMHWYALLTHRYGFDTLLRIFALVHTVVCILIILYELSVMPLYMNTIIVHHSTADLE